MTDLAAATLDRALVLLPERVRDHTREQVLVAVGQGVAGVGNLAFALVMARVLAPAEFAVLASFLALFLVVNAPLASLTAGTAATPSRVRRLRRRALAVAAVVGIGAALLAGPLAGVLDVPAALVLVLAAAVPGAVALAVQRGRLYGLQRHGRVAGTLVAEPAVRLTLGIVLGVVAGAVGAAVGIVVAALVGLAVATVGVPSPGVGTAGVSDDVPAGLAGGTMLAFLVLAVVQNQDVLLANLLLTGGTAGEFAALSTLGGLALFAVWNVPLVVLPRAKAGDDRAVRVALAIAAGLAAAVTAVTAAIGPGLMTTMFGDAYTSVGPWAAGYVGAMGLLGVARVLVVHRLADDRIRSTVLLLVLAAAAQAAMIVLGGDTPGAVALRTLAATGGLLVVLGLLELRRSPGPATGSSRSWASTFLVRTRARLRDVFARPDAWFLAGTLLVALVLRLLSTRGLWVDEAISVSQARLGFVEMIGELARNDVHPPLHGAVLWVSTRVLGFAEWALRLPSVLAGTAAVAVGYLTAREVFGRRTARVAALLLTVAPILVWYAQEARMYAFYALFGLVAVRHQLRVLGWTDAPAGRRRDWLLYGLATALLCWTHYFAFLQVGAQQLVFVGAAVTRWKDRVPVWPLVRGWLLTVGAVALLVAPIGLVVAEQLAGYGQRSADLPAQAGTGALYEDFSIYRLAVNGIWAVVGYHADRTMTLLAALWPALMVLAFVVLGRGPLRRATKALGVLVAVPLLLLFGVGLVRNNVFEIRYVITIVPLLFLLLARLVTTVAGSRVARATMVTGLCAVLALGLVDQQLNSANPRQFSFEQAFERVESEVRPGDLLVVAPDYLEPVRAYYSPDVESVGLDDREAIAETQGRVILLGSFLDEETVAGDVGTVLAELEEDRRLVDEYTLPQIKVWTFS